MEKYEKGTKYFKRSRNKFLSLFGLSGKCSINEEKEIKTQIKNE